MADKTIVRNRLRFLKTNNITHRVVADKINLEFVYLQDYTDDNFAKFIVPYQNLQRIPTQDTGVNPIGMTQIDVPYECISTIEIFGIEQAMLTKLEAEQPNLIKKYNLMNRTKGVTAETQLDLMGIKNN